MKIDIPDKYDWSLSKTNKGYEFCYSGTDIHCCFKAKTAKEMAKKIKKLAEEL